MTSKTTKNRVKTILSTAGGITIYIGRIVPFTTATAGLRQTKSSTVNIKASMANKSKANGWSSKLLIISDKVHYAAAMADSEQTMGPARLLSQSASEPFNAKRLRSVGN